jgi:hypothetical protein
VPLTTPTAAVPTAPPGVVIAFLALLVSPLFKRRMSKEASSNDLVQQCTGKQVKALNGSKKKKVEEYSVHENSLLTGVILRISMDYCAAVSSTLLFRGAGRPRRGDRGARGGRLEGSRSTARPPPRDALHRSQSERPSNNNIRILLLKSEVTDPKKKKILLAACFSAYILIKRPILTQTKHTLHIDVTQLLCERTARGSRDIATKSDSSSRTSRTDI